jgi:hypothetical protein
MHAEIRIVQANFTGPRRAARSPVDRLARIRDQTRLVRKREE